MAYIPHTNDDIKKILSKLDINSTDELFKTLPKVKTLFPHNSLQKEPIAELEIERYFEKLASKNKIYKSENIFLGAGSYYHYIPKAIDAIVSRQEFYTAYTPYQAEVSQGTLRAIFEFQTAISEILDFPVVNASMYDGATATAEAILMSFRKNRGKKKTVLLASTIHKEYLEVIENYTKPYGINLINIPHNNGVIQFSKVKELYNDDVFSFVSQYPNFYGIIEEETEQMIDFLKDKTVNTISVTIDGTALALLKTPAKLGFDISVMEIQSFGNPLAYGGPHAGVIATTKDFLRLIPGRIVGQTEDTEKNTAFVLTLSTREQHIRREKATSNICTNQSLIALRSIIYLSLMGQDGLKTVAENSYKNSHYLYNLLINEGFEILDNETKKNKFYNEFLLKIKNSNNINKKLKEKGFLAGYPMKEGLLLATTEMNTKTSIENFVKELKSIIK